MKHSDCSVVRVAAAVLITLLTLLTLAVVSCNGDDKAGTAGPVLAEVNDGVITPDDLLITIDLLFQPHERAGYATPQGRAQALQKLIIMEMFYQEGVAQGLEQDPRINKIMENYKRYLIFNTLMTRGINIQRVSDFFQTNFVHVAIIFLPKNQDASDKDVRKIKSRADKLRRALAEGADFAERAKKQSKHPSAKNGGDLGAITRSQRWELPMTDAALMLTAEAPLSKVVETPKGFYIIKLIHPAGYLPVELLSAEIEQNIHAHLLMQNYSTYAAQLQTQAKVEVNAQILENMKMGNYTGADASFLPAIVPQGTPGKDTMYTP